MNTTTSVVLTGGIVAAGQWAQDKQVSIKMVVGIGMLALFLSVMAEASPDLAQAMGALVLVSAVFIYGPDVVKALDLA